MTKTDNLIIENNMLKIKPSLIKKNFNTNRKTKNNKKLLFNIVLL